MSKVSRPAFLFKKLSGEGRDWANTGQRGMLLELWTREEIQEKTESPLLRREPQVTIIGASIRKMLVA
jgi:hypothetical protein